jgi:hypothetical protein
MPWTSLVDMAMTPEEQTDMCMPVCCGPDMSDKPAYPYGLCICLTDGELKKLGLEADCDVGDMIDMRCFGIVTSVSKNQKADGTNSARVEIQLQKLAVEDEMREDTSRGR